MSRALPTYAIVTAVRDEERFFRTTGLSVIAQTHRPRQWVIVDDGSKDRTRSIAESFAAQHDWITVVDSGVDHARARGAPIVAAFNTGRDALARRSDLIVKMDGDLFLPANYFEWVAATFAHDPRAGIVGGVVLIHDGECWRVDAGSHHNVNGVAKAYRVDCLEEIGGLRPSMGWDGIDEYGAKSRGWRVHVLRELSILHYERRGAKQPWHRARFEEGRGAHFMGYLPAFLLVRALYRMLVERPPVLGGLALLAGFFYAHLAGADQIDDELARASLRAEQRARLARLARGKSQLAVEPLPGGGPAFWVTQPVPEDVRAGVGNRGIS